MSTEKKNLILVFSLIATAAIGGIIFLLGLDLAKKDSVGFEVVKVLAQFLLVGVLGVLISLLVQNYNRQRDKEGLVNDLRKTVLTDLITAYSDTKRARRIIMGNRLSNEKLPYKIYDEQIRNIIATQLAFELITHQITTHQSYFGKNVKLIISNVTKMEKYLGDIIDEYKDVLRGQSQIPEILSLSSLPKLSSSMGKEREANNFKKEFVEPYRATVEEIRQQVLT
jgi:hypothetical protein